LRAKWFVTASLLGVLATGVAACGDDGGGGGGGGGGGNAIEGSKLTIYSSLPQQGASGPQAEAMQNGAKLAVEAKGGKVGNYSITYTPLDDSLASSGAADEGKAAQNARKAVQDKTTGGYIGEYNSGISKVTIPILNKAGIAQISPANTYVGLTTDEPGSEPGEPTKYYPARTRTYARVVPKDTIQGAALATVAKDDGCGSIHIWNSQTTYSAGLARNVEMSAEKLGLTVEGNDGIDPKAPNYRSLAAKIKADCFIFTGEIESNGIQAIKDAAAVVKGGLYGGDGIVLNDTADPKKGLPANVGARFKGTIATLDPAEFGPDGKKFFEDYVAKYGGGQPDPYAIYGYEAMSLMLDAMDRDAKANGGKISRAGVVKEIFATKGRNSVLGTYDIDKNGDTTLTDYGLYKIADGKLAFDKVIKAQAG
jgi:branched-chain amino acid transport system substrate-binding protein